MKLEVLISKKGTKVVKATNLHAALLLPNDQYGKNVRKWLKEVYGFRDGIRTPSPMVDFAKKSTDNPVVYDYFITIELAKLIALNSTSKVKRKFANHLSVLDEEIFEEKKAVSPEAILEVISLAKKMGSVSFQAANERRHLERYKSENGSAANWWQYRESILGYSSSFWKDGALSNKELAKGMSQRELLFNADKYETIRAGVVDYYMSIGKTADEAQELGDLAKTFADKLGLEVWDDRQEAKPQGARVRDLKQQDVQPQQVLWAS